MTKEMTNEQAINGLKENLCSLCVYGSQNMDNCDIRECDNRDYIKALEQQFNDKKIQKEKSLAFLEGCIVGTKKNNKVKEGKLMSKNSFVEMCLNGEADLFELDEYIEYWHTHDTDLSLREYLGLTPSEYAEWGNGSDSIFRDILRCRREGISFEEIKALEQQPSDDCVSRAEVIDELNRLGRNAFKDDTDYDNFFAFVDSLPPVTPTHGTCKDCSHYDPLTCNSGTCLNPNMQWSNEVSATHYCTDFEKRGSEDD